MSESNDKLYIIIILGLIGGFIYWFHFKKQKLYCHNCKIKIKKKKVRFQKKEEIINKKNVNNNITDLDSLELDSVMTSENKDDNISIDM